MRSQGKFREGNRIGERLLDEGSSNFTKSIAYYEMAYNLAEMEEDLDEALDYARRSVELSPDEIKQFPLAALGWVHYKRKEFDKAVDFLSQVERAGTVLHHPHPSRHGPPGLGRGGPGAQRARPRPRRMGERGEALQEKMMECMKDSTRLIERARRSTRAK